MLNARVWAEHPRPGWDRSCHQTARVEHPLPTRLLCVPSRDELGDIAGCSIEPYDVAMPHRETSRPVAGIELVRTWPLALGFISSATTILTRAAGASPRRKQPQRLVSGVTGLAPGALPVPLAFAPAEGNAGPRGLKPADRLVAKLVTRGTSGWRCDPAVYDDAGNDNDSTLTRRMSRCSLSLLFV